MRKCTVRAVPSDFAAFKMANAMLSVGVEPFSVVFVPPYERRAGMPVSVPGGWYVFGKYEEAADENAVSDAVDKAFMEMPKEFD